MKRALASAALTGAMSVGLVACGHTNPTHTVLISDVTLSGLSQDSRLDAVAEQQAAGLVASLQAGDQLTVYAFGDILTSACEPIEADFPTQGNSEDRKQLKADLEAQIGPAYATYVKCVRNKAHGGSSRAGSPIFGAITEAYTRASASGPVTAISLVTDGCSYGEGVPTCSKNMTKPGYAEQLVEKMPAALKPDLSGVVLTVAGLGQGTGMSSQQVSVLRAIFSSFATATHSTVEFK